MTHRGKALENEHVIWEKGEVVGKKERREPPFLSPVPSRYIFVFVLSRLSLCTWIGDSNLPSPVKATGKSHDQHPHTASAFWEYVVRGGGIVVKEVIALTLLSILPHLRFVQCLELKYCNTEFIVRQ